MTSTRSFSVAPVVAAARRGVPVVQTLHNYELISASPTDHRGGRLDRGQDAASVRWLRAALNVTRRTLHVPRVNRWIAVSSYVAETYARHGIGADVLPNFIAAEPPGTSRSFEERRGIVFAGRLTAEKGVNDVIALAEHLRGTPVTVVGRGPLEPQVREAEGDRYGERVEKIYASAPPG